MKQRVSQKQLDKLSTKAFETLLAWEQEKGYTIDNFLEAPTIGQLIHFLSERVDKDTHFEILRERVFLGGWGLNYTASPRPDVVEKELIDRLWIDVWALLDNDHE